MTNTISKKGVKSGTITKKGGQIIDISNPIMTISFNHYDDYTLVDPNSRVSRTATSQTITLVPNGEEAYSYYDAGVGYFSGDFTVQFKLNVPFTGADSQNGQFGIWGVSNNIGDFYTQRVAVAELIGLQVYAISSGRQDYQLYLSTEWMSVDDTLTSLLCNTDYYITITRDDDGGGAGKGLMTVTVYTDSARTAVFGTITQQLNLQKDLRYVYSFSSWNVGSLKPCSGIISNLEITTP